MTGPEHYREAERMLTAASDAGKFLTSAAKAAREEAQVHATLALAAATATGSADMPSGDWDDWRYVASAGHAGRIPGSERAVKP